MKHAAKISLPRSKTEQDLSEYYLDTDFCLDSPPAPGYYESPMKQTTTLDPEQLRQAMRAWSSGVTVVTATHTGEGHGMTVNSFTSVSLEPPLIIISLQGDSRTQELVSLANAFAVTILAEDQQDLSDRFAGRVPDTEDRLAGLEIETLLTGAPLLKGGLAYLDCRVVQTIPVGANSLFLAEVVAARSNGVDSPLLYHNRKYHKIDEK
jgi:flavin reductase (DIM6/NTAB) family NADH-FMN oxidoreductase RutF